ncbi:MAG: cation transporter [Desulfovibrionaceae bacterium]|nr:cation transporter [Desulfovibrionaceae bacterium]MBF0513997.1 cation transporter [Desulfovibrionaceae bacterium]
MSRNETGQAAAAAPHSCGCAHGGRAQDTRGARKLEYLTIGWSLVEAGVALGAGIVAGSIALVGFGADTLIEILSSLILLWRLASVHPDERRERIALQLVGVCFLLLAAYVGYEAVSSLALKKPPEASFAGMALAVLALIVMPLLARAKRRAAGRLHSAALSADSRQSSLCAYLSAILLGGLVLNAAFGWWWADPVAALVMLPIIVKEGLEALRGEVCADCH